MVPCHRVISSDLTIGGFNGSKDIASQEICNKIALLKAENVATIRNGNKIKVCKNKI